MGEEVLWNSISKILLDIRGLGLYSLRNYSLRPGSLEFVSFGLNRLEFDSLRLNGLGFDTLRIDSL